ncbi:MAG: hypothetical protein AAF607_08380 [Pseudomonadota bacterium]
MAGPAFPGTGVAAWVLGFGALFGATFVVADFADGVFAAGFFAVGAFGLAELACGFVAPVDLRVAFCAGAAGFLAVSVFLVAALRGAGVLA